jgi:FdhD protein
MTGHKMPQSLAEDASQAAEARHATGGWRSRSGLVWRNGVAATGARDLAEETPVAMIYDAATHAVMMASPRDLEDFALGFSLTEGVISGAGEIADLEIVDTPQGVEARMWLTPCPRAALAQRRRHLAGPTGCGLCGVDSLAEAVRTPPSVVSRLSLTPAQVMAAMQALGEAQVLGARTRAVHAAGFWTPAEGLVALREDVGRHNALDKLAGALARGAPVQGALAQSGRDGAEGAVLLTSRVSVEMVQKTARIGAGVLVAVSAPTTLAVETAEAAGITLVAVARADGFEVFTHPQRVAM